jgi:membrane fusion protein (multidrug efflux system)
MVAVAGCTARAVPEQGPTAPSVTVTESRKMTLPIVVNPIGTTRALEEVTIRARVRGFLTERHFEYGKNVKKGRLLLVIDEEPFKVQLDRAQAQLAADKAALEKATKSQSREVSKARLELSQAQFRLDEVEERRTRNLFARKAASQDDLDKSIAQRKKSAAQVDSDRASAAQALSDYTIDIDTAQANVANSEAAVNDAQINLNYCRMYAPIDGRIGELKVKIGNLVGDTGQTELVTIEQLDPMGLDLHPPARYLPVATALVASGLEVRLTVEGERRHPHVGKAIFVDNVVEPTTSTFLLRASVPNPDGSLLPGQYVTATMTVGQYVDAVVVPEQSVALGQEGTRVFVVDAQKQVQEVKVSAVDVYEGLRVLASGLEPGQRVIVEGIQLVRPDQVVKTVFSPLETYIHAETEGVLADPRFSSPISRVPGMDSPAGKDSPPAGKPASEPRKEQSPAGKTPVNSQGQASERPARPPATKQR